MALTLWSWDQCSQHSIVLVTMNVTENVPCLAQGYEIPRDFIVDMEPFSKSNHLLTDSGKPARGKLKAK